MAEGTQDEHSAGGKDEKKTRRRGRNGAKAHSLDEFAIGFLDRLVEDQERFHNLLMAHLDGTNKLNSEQTRVLLKILDMIEKAVSDIEVGKGRTPKGTLTKGKELPQVPMMGSVMRTAA